MKKYYVNQHAEELNLQKNSKIRFEKKGNCSTSVAGRSKVIEKNKKVKTKAKYE